jgi:histidinol-phosphatase (PHP family)
MVASSTLFSASLCDTHVHTRLCGHATGEMEEYVQAAIARGLRKLIFLEHMEEGISSPVTTWLSEKDFDNYFSEGKRLKDQYESQIEIGLGVECGYNPDYGDLLGTRLRSRHWDQVGISCHFLKVEGIEHHINLFSRKKENIQLARQAGAEHLLDRYFTALTDAVRRLPGTMLCHLDGALRFLPEIQLTKYHYELIDKLLRAVRAKQMSLEINSSGLAIRNEQFPTRRIIAMADSYDIPFLFGSDAHRPEDVGRYFDITKSLVPSAPSP